jgi:hypothetical protein
MNGQWIGPYSGTNTGSLVADLDDVRTRYAGVFFGYDNNPALPTAFAQVEIPKGQTTFSLRVGLSHLERGSGLLLTPGSLAQKFPGVETPTHADTEWQVTPTQIVLKWRTNIGTNGDGSMVKSAGQNPSLLTPRSVRTWEEFKKFVLTLEPYRFDFRGHEKNTWRLRTAFHRTGRANLMKFIGQDVPALHRHLSGLTTHHFDLKEPLDYAAFLNLAQHHGYPTPILDWTQSPFVAAYFAFKDLRRNNLGADQKIRILILDAREWNKNERAQVLMPGFLHMTMLEPLPINNPRALPQQSVSSFTNVDDPERLIHRFGDHPS